MSTPHGQVSWRLFRVLMSPWDHPGTCTAGAAANSAPSNSLFRGLPFTLCCLFVRRAAGCRKRGVPERPELDILSASALAIFRGKRCVPTLNRAGPRTAGLAPVKGVYFPRQPPPLQLVSIERGAGQYITSKEFLSCTPRQRGLRRQSSAPDRLRAEGAVEETKDVCSWGRGGGGGWGLRRVCVPSGMPQRNQTAPRNSRAKASRGHGRGGSGPLSL